MKLWHISQEKNNGWDTYSDAVVAAETEDAARNIHPCVYYSKYMSSDSKYMGWDFSTWVSPSDVVVKYIGEAVEGTEAGVICASFHAG